MFSLWLSYLLPFWVATEGSHDEPHLAKRSALSFKGKRHSKIFPPTMVPNQLRTQTSPNMTSKNQNSSALENDNHDFNTNQPISHTQICSQNYNVGMISFCWCYAIGVESLLGVIWFIVCFRGVVLVCYDVCF